MNREKHIYSKRKFILKSVYLSVFHKCKFTNYTQHDYDHSDGRFLWINRYECKCGDIMIEKRIGDMSLIGKFSNYITGNNHKKK